MPGHRVPLPILARPLSAMPLPRPGHLGNLWTHGEALPLIPVQLASHPAEARDP